MYSPLQPWRWPYSTADFHSGRRIFPHTTHESHILLDSSVRAEPRFIVKELVCAPASCTEASAAPLPVPALHNGQVPCSPCDPGATTRPAGTGTAPLMALYCGAKVLLLTEKGFPPALFEERNETWTLPVPCPGSGPGQWSEVEIFSVAFTQCLCCTFCAALLLRLPARYWDHLWQKTGKTGTIISLFLISFKITNPIPYAQPADISCLSLFIKPSWRADLIPKKLWSSSFPG